MSTEPTLIGPYQLQRVLGRGGMGVVYHATHAQTGEAVALKTVNVTHNATLHSLRREIHVLSQLRHPGIVRILESGLHNGVPWYAMELLEGITLRHVIERELQADGLEAQHTQPDLSRTGTLTLDGMASVTHLLSEIELSLDPGQASTSSLSRRPLPASSSTRGRARPTARRKLAPSTEQLIQLLTVIRRLCTPLAYLHGEGVVHRDLKPENIFFRPDGMPVLLDFGLTVTFRDADNREALQIDRHHAGSANYMAPEQLAERTVDARADLYALGCILYELLTGTPPYANPSQVSITYGHLCLEPTPPSELVEGIPQELDRLVLRLLAKAPQQRLGYAEDLSLMLAWFGARGDFAQGPPPRPYAYRSGLVGREEPRAALGLAIERLEHSGGGMLLVRGEGGIGKTRLVHEVAQEAARRELLVLAGQCPHTGGLPLEGLRHPLLTIADLCREGGPAATARILGAGGALLSLYEPSLAQVPGVQAAAQTAGVEEIDRERLGFALLETLRGLASEQLVLLVLDDLQWADPLILELLHFLADRGQLESGGVLVIGTYRSEESPARLQNLAAHPRVKSILLPPLGPEALPLMLEDMLASAQTPPRLVDYLARHAGGNPFFITEYLRIALEEGLLWRDSEGRWQLTNPTTGEATGISTLDRLPLPRSLEALLARRLNQLPPAANAVAQMVAAVSRPCPLHLLREIAQRDDAELFGACQELMRRQVLVESSPGTLRFVQEAQREAAYQRIPAQDRPALHRAIAEATEKLLPDSSSRFPAFLGHHWERAGQPLRARERYQVGAEDALRRLALADCERLMEAALRLAERPDETACLLRNRLGSDVLRAQGRLSDALEQHQRALHDARSLGFVRGEAISLYHLGQLARQEGDLEQAERLIRDGISRLERAPYPLERGMLLGSYALLLYDRGQLEQARAHFEQAIALLEPLGSLRPLATVLANYATCLHALDAIAEALPWYERAIATCRSTGAHLLEAQLLTNLGTYQLEQGQLERARTSLTGAITLHRALGHRQGLGATLPVMAMFVRLIDGDFGAAEALAREGLKLLLEVGVGTRPIFNYCELGHIELARGRLPTELLCEAQERLKQHHLSPQSAYAQRIVELEQAMASFEAGRSLLRGSRPSDLAPGLRRALSARMVDEEDVEGPTLHD